MNSATRVPPPSYFVAKRAYQFQNVSAFRSLPCRQKLRILVAAALKTASSDSSMKSPVEIPKQIEPTIKNGVETLSDTARSVVEIQSLTELLSKPEMQVTELQGTTFWQALLNSVNILLGVGLLTIPYALSKGGWMAIIALLIMGLTTNYTGKLLGLCQERECLLEKRPVSGQSSRILMGLESYEDIGEAAFGGIGRAFITFVLYVELVGTCGLFFILEGDNLSRLFGGDARLYMLASSLLLIPTTWLPDLSALSALGALGALAASSVLGVVLYTFIAEGFPVGAVHSLVHLDSLPFTFGILSFVYAGHAVFPNIKASMRNPEEYPRMLDYTYLIVASVCAIVGVVGYQMYGEDVMQEITLNLPSGIVAVIATGLIVVNPFTKFALTMEPVARGLETFVQRKADERNGLSESKGELNSVIRIVSRTSLGATALLLATTVPIFANVMSIIGSCLTLIVSVIFPSVAYLKLFDNRLTGLERWCNYGVVTIGFACAVAGTYSAISSIGGGSGSLM